MNFRIVLAGFCLVLIVIIISFLGQEKYKERDNKSALKNKNMVKQLSTEEYKELIEKKGVWNLDVREGYEFNAGYIEGAKLVPSTRFDEFFDELKIKKSEKIALYCRSGSRSSFVAQKLSDKGYTNIYNLELGFLDWQRQGFKIVKKL